MDEKGAQRGRADDYRELRLEHGRSKSSSQHRHETGRARSIRALRQYLVIVISLYFIIIYVLPKIMQGYHLSDTSPTNYAGPSIVNTDNLVMLEAHIMSKCPDARDCLRDLVVPAMENISAKVDFRLSYIGSVGDDDTVQCKHGSTECLGNMLGLCAAELYPNDVKRSLGFTTCMILSYREIPSRDLVEHCALEHGVNFDDLNRCASEEGHGLDLLETSIERSRDAGVVKSCTVRVGGEQWCIRDNAQWKQCAEGHEINDLISAIEARYIT